MEARSTTLERKRSLDVLVTDVATELMSVDAVTAVDAYQTILHKLVDYFSLDASFLRHNDFTLRATLLVAEWPPRESVPDPDPLAVVYFDTADAVFASVETLAEPTIYRPEPTTEQYRQLIEVASGFITTSTAVVPMIAKDHTSGVLGFVRQGDRGWDELEINALKAIAAQLAQLQARVTAEEQLRYSVLHDDVTDLSNRRDLILGLEQRLAPGACGSVAVLFLDLDRLKALNDYLGHTAGDQYIRAIADRLRENLGSENLIARLGGDEFMIVLDHTHTLLSATVEAKRILGLINQHVTLGGEVVTRSASIGIAVAVPGAMTPEDLLRQADHAALSAKTSGGNGIAVYTAEMAAQNKLRSDVEIHLRDAIVKDELVLHFQPEVDLLTGKITAVEALVRWDHPTRGLLQPNDFIPVAETTNLAAVLGRWVLGTACRIFAEWRANLTELDIMLRVNASPLQLVTADFVETVSQLLETSGIGPHSLCIEVTEMALVQDVERTRVTLRRLRDLGVKVAIDDFGTGYSSLSHLKLLPVDSLKIDRSFVQHLGDGSDDLAIVKAISGLAHSFNLDLIAEGVETTLARATLLALGCRRAQGYLFSRPVPAPDMLTLLRTGTIAI